MDKADSVQYKVFSYRWVVLLCLVPIIVSSEIFWLTFAAITTPAAEYYKTSAENINLFSLAYMFMYIIFTMPASKVIEKYGYKVSIIIGSVLTVVFGATRFIFADNFILALVSQFLLAAGQPFLVNISTKVPANWFPLKERSTASGILVMAQYIGFIIPMIVSPALFQSMGMQALLGIYAGIALITALVAIFFTKEKPAIPPGPEAPKESMGFRNMGKLLLNKNFTFVLVISFISMGIFNTIMTVMEQFLNPKGIGSQDAGIILAVLVVSGIIGAFVLPMFSDKIRRRIPLFIIAMPILALLCVGLAFFTNYILIIVACALFGFSLMGMAPILFQHGAEVAYPVQEGASFGTIMLMGQISGILFVILFDVIFKATNAYLWPMLFLIILAVVQIPVAALMKESKILKESREQWLAAKKNKA
jgi:MFS transporter, FLVCR family, MFS-domain-containing protein 7